MKAHIQKLALTGLLSILITCFSCEKMLDVDLPENQIDRDLVFEDAQTANAALAALYAGVRDNTLFTGDKIGPHIGVYTDDLDTYSITATNGILEMYRNEQIDNNAIVYTNWANTYKEIYTANSLLEGVESSQNLAKADRDRIRGEALFLRSLMLFYLQQLFGDIPYPVTTSYLVNQSMGKTPSSEVLSKLHSDLTECRALLKDDYSNTERIFVNRKTVELALAHVLMNQQQYAEAESILKTIVQSPLYTLEPDLSKVFLKSGKHILWQLKPKNPGDATREASIYYFTGVAPSSYALTPNLVNAFSSMDQRKNKWMAAVTVGANTWYRADKYKVRSSNTTEYSIVFRLEEVQLLLAEALTKQNKVSEALPYVNATRVRAGLGVLPTAISQASLADEILAENRKEFFTEMGHRFFDLKRAGRLQVLTAVKNNWKTFHQRWPIPQKEIQLNPNLNPQNPGY